MDGRTRIRIDVVSDIVCPWCVIGFSTFDRVRQDFADRLDIDLHWQPFELNPQMGPGGQDLREHVREKYGASTEQSRRARERIASLGEAIGFEFRYGEGTRIYNTFAAHQLVAWGAERRVATTLMRELFGSYFHYGEDVSRPEILAVVAERAGLDSAEAQQVLEDGRYAEAVRDRERTWIEQGIHAVPSFVVDGRGVITGAQDAALFTRVCERLAGSGA